MRLDLYLVENSLLESRARAQAAIAAGLVRVNGAVAVKASMKVASDDNVVIAGDVHPFVSRGGLKLDAALRAMEINPENRICLDLGASTGGFTDVLLRAGAKKIYAVDVGRGQLHEKISTDPRVVNMEQTHAKDLSPALVPDALDLIVCDVSFISLKKTLPFTIALAAPEAAIIALIKPQFEVGRDGIGKGGMVKPGFAAPVVRDIEAWMRAEGWRVIDVMESPVTGGDGNREFLIGASKTA